jgi:predicted type IV restriction endonuclease
LVWIALVLSLLACATSAFFYWRSRRQHELSVEQFSNRVSKLLSEFNSVTSEKVDLLDDRTEELRRIVDLANLKIKKLNRLIDRVEAVEDNAVDAKESSPVVDTEDDEQNRVLELAEEGKSPAEIADVTDLTPGEISVILKINRSRVEETKA